jgi:hypothetical protein
MTYESIRISNVNDSVEAAHRLQQAVDLVLNPRRLQEMDNISGGDQVFQYIYSVVTQPPAGCVSMIVGGYGETQDITMLSLKLYLPGYRGGSDNTYVPRRVIDKLRVQLEGVSPIRSFERAKPPSNKWMEVRILLPTRTFQRYPRALITAV